MLPRTGSPKAPSPPVKIRPEGRGSATADDPALAKDIADARACRDLARVLEGRVRSGLMRLEPMRATPSDPTRRAFHEAVGNSIRNGNLVGCQIQQRLGTTSGTPRSIQSIAVVDSAEVVEIVRSALESARSSGSDSTRMDTFLIQLPALLGPL